MKTLHVILIGFMLLLLLLNCARMTIQQVEDIGVYTVFELAGILSKLTSLDSHANIDGLQALSDRYDIDIVTPVQDFFDAAKFLIRSLDDLRQAIYRTDAETDTRTISPQEHQDRRRLERELEKLFEDITL